LRNQTAAAIKNAGLNTLRTARTGTPLQGYLATLKLSANTPVFKGATAVLAPPVAADVSNRTGFTGQIEGALNKVGPALDQLFSGTPQVIQQYGREQEKKGWGGAFETASYLMGPGVAGTIVTPAVASLTAPFIPNTQPASVATTLPRRPIANLPADYKRTELQAGAAAEAFRPGAGFPSQQQVSAPVLPPVIVPEIDASLPPAGNVGALTGNALYRAAREAGYDNTSQLGLSQWAKYYQGRLPEATAELAAIVESEEAKAREFLDNYLNQNLP
jgi:hypothetical protein